MVLLEIIVATVLVSLVSLSGIAAFSLLPRRINDLFFVIVAFAAGTLLGAAFFDVLPEAIDAVGVASALPMAFAGMMCFFALEALLSWHHHHSAHTHGRGEPHEKPLGWLNLVSDGVHNLFDGVAIAAAFMVNPVVGVSTTLAVALHEIPQEIGDYGLLLYSGFSHGKAVAFNLLTALTAVLGALLFYFGAPLVEGLSGSALAFTAGMFIYIAAADLFPELHKERAFSRSMAQLGFVLAGALLIALLVRTFEH